MYLLFDSQDLEFMKSTNYSVQLIQNYIAAIREEHNTDARIKMLHKLNSMLPEQRRIEMPSLITNAYVRRALDVIQESALENTVCA